jgi:lipopolysaccharide transport system ATP-binding protein
VPPFPVNRDLAISVDNVCKAYRIWTVPSARITVPIMNGVADNLPRGSRLRSKITARAASRYRDFWALDNITFVLKKGEALGVIGRNGSGKSTLLQIIAGTLQPTTGTVQLRGRVSALLELGSGFNPEFTGRENVYLNGSVLGLSRREIDERYDQIADFADIGEFIEQPVKTYSSGMMIRLAFAVAVSVDPELLIVDEALSVGDVFFQQKCFKRVHEMLEKGVSLLFVSHDTAAVQNLCDRAILLVQGRQVFEGPPEEAASRYFAQTAPAAALKSTTGVLAPSNEREGLARIIAASNMRQEAASEHGARDLEIVQVGVCDENGRPARNFAVGAKLHIVAELRASTAILDPNTGIHLYDRMNNLVFGAGTRQTRTLFPDFSAGERRLVEFVLKLSVQPGSYTLSVGCGQASDNPNAGYVQHRLEGLGPITVMPHEGTWPFYGMAALPLAIKLHG